MYAALIDRKKFSEMLNPVTFSVLKLYCALVLVNEHLSCFDGNLLKLEHVLSSSLLFQCALTDIKQYISYNKQSIDIICGYSDEPVSIFINQSVHFQHLKTLHVWVISYKNYHSVYHSTEERSWNRAETWICSCRWVSYCGTAHIFSSKNTKVSKHGVFQKKKNLHHKVQNVCRFCSK